eukprot:1153185-Pelagomonas_calceolata.AAC.1
MTQYPPVIFMTRHDLHDTVPTSDLHDARPSEHSVLWLYITMGYASGVQVERQWYELIGKVKRQWYEKGGEPVV